MVLVGLAQTIFEQESTIINMCEDPVALLTYGPKWSICHVCIGITGLSIVYCKNNLENFSHFFYKLCHHHHWITSFTFPSAVFLYSQLSLMTWLFLFVGRNLFNFATIVLRVSSWSWIYKIQSSEHIINAIGFNILYMLHFIPFSMFYFKIKILNCAPPSSNPGW